MLKDSYGNQRFYGIYRGIVKNNADPFGMNRVKLQIPQVLFEAITDWAWPRNDHGVHVDPPAIGQGVWVQFEGGDPSFPVWVGTFGTDSTILNLKLNELTDVNTDGVTDGQVLKYQASSGTWITGTGGSGTGLPPGGTAGQILAKNSSTDGDASWYDNISISQTIQQYVKAGSGAPFYKGQAVYISSADGTNAIVSLAQANSDALSSKTLGLLLQDLLTNGSKGYVITEGLLQNIDTSAAGAAGDTVWLSPTTPGGLVYGLANKPYAPNHMVFIGYVVKKNASTGEIYIKPQNGFELDELHNVDIAHTTSLNNGDIIKYNSSTLTWQNAPQSSLAIGPSQVTGTAVTQADTGTVTSTMILNGTIVDADINASAAISVDKLSSKTVTIGTTSVNLGASTNTLSGLTSVSATTFTGALTGNADTATTLATARTINGVSFNGSANITITASTTNSLGLTSGGNLAFSSGTTWDGGTSGITIGLSTTPTGITSINSVTMPTSGSFITSATTSLPNVTTVNGTTIPSSKTLVSTTDLDTGDFVVSGGTVSIKSAGVDVGQGGTGQSTLTLNGVVLGNGTSAVNVTAAGSANQPLRVPAAGGAPAFGSLDISQSAVVGTSILPIANGGTNASSASGARTNLGVGATTFSDTAPVSPSAGDIWICTLDQTEYVYYNDGNSSQWVQIQANAAIDTALTNRVTAVETTRAISPNYIINGGFDIWQRGTSFSAAGYTADRWLIQADGAGATRTISQQTFTPGNPITSNEPQYFLRYAQTVAGSGATYNIIDQRIEDVRTLAGQTVTVSFWAKAASAGTYTSQVQQVFGTGGSAEVQAIATQSLSVTTSWQRFTYTATMPSISGKTIGTGSYIVFRINLPNNATFTFDVWGVQMEAGSTATTFQRNAPSIQAELAACQRYYYRAVSESTYGWFGPLYFANTTLGLLVIPLPVNMRTAPTTIDASAIGTFNLLAATGTLSSLTISADGYNSRQLAVNVNGASFTTNGAGFLRANNTTTAYIGASAEL